ncbi:helix-turn-helix domain-containing protein [Anaerocolumna sp. AGMB13020]|uniref:helix-turn-helix domain-containing protein n=1 Tax=Anaerocolumna sp. AGMB13020 TaxID=3081750 RepID=UPI00295313B2|nr:helix-turn-helix domain-containing protein [Anaerocolumna sp. AGMB13020]WOO36057.1 helix-turn-helix domain-containing protein [Anaerocolumna sp. AGMB13020]
MKFGKFMTVSEYCSITGLSRSGTYNRIRQGKIPVFIYSDKKLIPRSILEETTLSKLNNLIAIE